VKGSKASASDILTLREALTKLRAGAAHQANDRPKPEEIFAPALHVNALDPQLDFPQFLSGAELCGGPEDVLCCDELEGTINR
jgi:hypothetical protein